MEVKFIKAREGCVFKRIYDGFVMGDTVYLGIDYSTGVARTDRGEYYEQIEKPVEPDKYGAGF